MASDTEIGGTEEPETPNDDQSEAEAAARSFAMYSAGRFGLAVTSPFPHPFLAPNPSIDQRAATCGKRRSPCSASTP